MSRKSDLTIAAVRLGGKGGATKGPSKIRGDSEYYRRLRAVGIERQAAKKAALEKELKTT